MEKHELGTYSENRKSKKKLKVAKVNLKPTHIKSNSMTAKSFKKHSRTPSSKLFDFDPLKNNPNQTSYSAKKLVQVPKVSKPISKPEKPTYERILDKRLEPEDFSMIDKLYLKSLEIKKYDLKQSQLEMENKLLKEKLQYQTKLNKSIKKHIISQSKRLDSIIQRLTSIIPNFSLPPEPVKPLISILTPAPNPQTSIFASNSHS